MPLPSLPRRRAWHSLAAALLTLMLATSIAPAANAVDGTSETSSALPELIVSPLRPVIEDTSEEVIFRIIVRNPGVDPIPAGTIALELNPQRVETIGDLDDEFPVSGSLLADAEVGETATADEQTLTITVARGDLPLSDDSAPGVYQLRARLTPNLDPESPMPGVAADSSSIDGDDGTGVLNSAITPIVWRGSGGSSVKLSLIVPLVLPSDIRTLPTRDQLGDVVPKLDRLLTTATAERATLAIDPRIIAGIRAYGDNTPEGAQRFLARLESSSLPNFLLQFADADPAAQAALGFNSLLEPTNLDFVSRFGTFPTPDANDTGDRPEAGNSDALTPKQEITSSPSPGRSDASQLSPTLQQLLSWSETDRIAWPAEGAADEGTVSLLRANGISSLVLDSDNVTQEGGPFAKLGEGSALITDASLGDATRTLLLAQNETERGAALSEVAARLTLAAQADAPGIVLGLDRGAVADADNPEQLLEDLAELNFISPTLHTEQATGTASLKSADTLEGRRELLRTAVDRERSVDEVGAILVNPEYLTGYQRTRLLDLFATRYAAPGADFTEAASEFQKRDAELMEGVRAISTEHTQLVGASTRIPLQLKNSLPFEALLTVRVDPASAGLTVSERTFSDIRVRPEGTERLLVPVQSRVSSGESGLVVSISDVSGDLTIYTGTLSISIRSSVETIALWTLGSLATLLLGFGIWRSVRRRRHISAVQANS